MIEIADAKFNNWTPHEDILLAPVRLSKFRLSCMRERLQALVDGGGQHREVLSLHTIRELLVMEPLEPRMNTNERGVFHKQRMMPFGGHGSRQDEFNIASGAVCVTQRAWFHIQKGSETCKHDSGAKTC